jgi:hypothetical protein
VTDPRRTDLHLNRIGERSGDEVFKSLFASPIDFYVPEEWRGIMQRANDAVKATTRYPNVTHDMSGGGRTR